MDPLAQVIDLLNSDGEEDNFVEFVPRKKQRQRQRHNSINSADVIDLSLDTERSALPDADSLKMCACCRENERKYRVLQCGHIYCMECIGIRVRQGLRDRTMVPAHCCRNEFPVEYVDEVLTVVQKQTYDRFMSERNWRASDLVSDRTTITRKPSGRTSCGNAQAVALASSGSTGAVQ